MLRQAILAASRSNGVRTVVSGAPVSRDVVARFVAGETTQSAVEASTRLEGEGLTVTLDHLGEDTLDAAQARGTVEAYLNLLTALSAAGLTADGRAEVSVKLSAVGQVLDEKMAADHAREICEAAAAVGTTVTLDMEDHTTTDSTLRILHDLRADHPSTGAVLQAYLHRTLDDCRDLAVTGSRVRLCKGAYREPETVAWTERKDIDLSYVRCMKVLLEGSGYPMLATHDPSMVAIGTDLANRVERAPGSFEFQMLYGIRPEEQKRLAGDGHTVRVYVPYGQQWYGYLMRRLAEKPANLQFFLRALTSKK